MSDRTDRSERLQRRFERDGSDEAAADPATGSQDTAEDDRAASAGSSSGTSTADGEPTATEDRSVKDRPSTLMYLPESIDRDLDLTFDEVNLTYRREYGEKLEKNRDYYPLVAIHGIDRLREWDAAEIRDALNRLSEDLVD